MIDMVWFKLPYMPILVLMPYNSTWVPVMVPANRWRSYVVLPQEAE
jgi:hypothetical protein